jgi:uncharacterized protein YraI
MLLRKLLIVFLILLVSIVATAQDNTCPAFVETALKAVGQACDQLGRNEACYGYNRVDANFWQVGGDLVFSTPADRVPLAEVQQIATAPFSLDQQSWGIAVLKVQANLPDTLPGQAVTMLLMGDAELKNAVASPAAEVTVTPVPGTVTSSANGRSMPTTTSNIVTALSAGDTVSIIGLNEQGDWYEIQRADGSHAWVWNSLVEAAEADLKTLPVTDAAVHYGPMQAFYFTARPGELGCKEAPSALILQSPQNISVMLNINGIELHLGSTVIFTMAALDDGTPVLVGTLVEGSIEAIYLAFTNTLTQPGQTFAVTLNAEGQVDENSRQVDLSGDSTVADAIHFGCESVRNNPLLPTPPDTCDFEMAYITTIPVANEGPLTNVGPNDACTVLAKRLSNLRGGPGTNYPWNGQLLEGQRALPDGYADGADGYRWFHLPNGNWIRSNLVDQAGTCDSLPTAEYGPPPAPPPPSAGTRFYEISKTCPDLNAVRPGQTITFQDGIGRWPTPAEKEAALAGQSATITVDGVALNVYYEGTTLHVDDGAPDGYGDRARASWVAVAGTHTVTASWTIPGPAVKSCVFTISP